MDYRKQPVLIETANHRITGVVALPEMQDRFRRGRFSDLLRAEKHLFVALTDVTIEQIDGSREPRHHEFVAVSRASIVYATDAVDRYDDSSVVDVA